MLATGCAGFAGAAAPSYDSYKSWLVACDNGLTCEAKGFEDGTNNNTDLRFDRAAGPQAATEVALNAPFSADWMTCASMESRCGWMPRHGRWLAALR